MAPEPGRRGAYGLHLPDLADAGSLLVEAPATWPTWNVDVVVDEAALRAAREPLATLTHETARSPIPGENWMVADRATRSSRLLFAHRPHTRELLHPYLSLSVGVAAFWAGDLAFHASALAGPGGAWAVVGARGAGKSTTVAAWAAAGGGVVTDDVLVVRDGMALAGPRSIDLRTDAGPRYAAEPLGVVGMRDRWRLEPAAVPAELRLAGFVVLDWGPEVTLDEVGEDRRLEAVGRALTLLVPPSNADALHASARLPMLTLRRPQDPSRIDESLARLRELTG